MRRVRFAYINTSIVIALVDRRDPKHEVVLMCLRRLRRLGFRVVTSEVLFEEPLRDPKRVSAFLSGKGVSVVHVDIPAAYVLAREVIRRFRISSERLYDAMHLIVARDIGAEVFVTADRKQRSLGRRLGLLVCHPIEIVEGRCP